MVVPDQHRLRGGRPQLHADLKAKFDIKRIALIYDVTQNGQRGEAEFIRNAAKDVGYEVVAFEAFRASDNDFRPLTEPPPARCRPRPFR